MSEPTTLLMTLRVGRFVAGAVERALREAAFHSGLGIVIERDMGWLEGILHVTLSGEERLALAMVQNIHAFVGRYSAEDTAAGLKTRRVQ